MENNLLLAKLRMPLMRPSAVARPRLMARLDEALNHGDIWQHKLTLVSAPAGYGKTTLLCQWLSGDTYPVAWLSLDENDNDPTRFLTHLIAACQQTLPDLGAGILDSVQSAAVTPGAPPIELALTNLLNELESIRNPLVLVLDDYHLIENKRVHEAVSFLIDNQPPPLHLAIASRTDPPLPIARLRAQAQLVEVHAADLSFAVDESAAFLNDVMGLGLTAGQVTALARRTEGWITGLQLAAIALQGSVAQPWSGQIFAAEQRFDSLPGQKGVSAFIKAFTGSHRFVLDYLTEEVLTRQSEETRTFLLESAILDRLSAALCGAVTGRKDGQQMLEMLSAANLFIIPLDDNRHWYRYHHLFAGLLRQRLQREKPDRVPELHRRASAWYEAEGWLAYAVKHALLAEDFGRAATLIEQNGWAMLMRGEMNTLLRWLEALPQEVLDERPSLGLQCAWAFAFSGQWEEMESVLLHVEAAEQTGELAAVRAYATAVQGAVEQTSELAEQALAQLPKGETFMRMLVTFCLAITHFSSGQPEPAARALDDVIRLGGEAGQSHLVMTAMAHLGHVYEMQGRLHLALETHHKALHLGSAAGKQLVPFHGIASVGVSEILYERNNLEGTLSYAQDGIRLTEQGGFVSYMLAGYARLVQVYQARGELKSAEEILQKGELLASQHKYRYLEGVFAELRVRQWLAQGKLAAAARWAHIRRSQEGQTTPLAQEMLRVTIARVLIAQGRRATANGSEEVELALAILDQALAEAKAAGRGGSQIRILALQAVAKHQQDETEKALTILGEALSLAEPEGYVRTFLDEGRPMAQLLRLAVTGSNKAGYAAALLAVFDEQALSSVTISPPLVEPLSERELEVLRLIVAGLSNREIAEELVIAISTVKSHINNIYGKLDVKRRAQAIARAQELGLL